MPGDGITDVAPIAQNQEKGRSASPQYYRRRNEYVYFDGWLELLWEWWPGIQDATNYPSRTRALRQQNWRVPQSETRDEWLFAPTVGDIAAQWPGGQDHTGRMPVTRKNAGLSRQYRISAQPAEETIVPTTVSNIAAWLPAVSIHNVRERRLATKTSMVYYTVLRAPKTAYYSQVTEVIGSTHITGGHFVFP